MAKGNNRPLYFRASAKEGKEQARGRINYAALKRMFALYIPGRKNATVSVCGALHVLRSFEIQFAGVCFFFLSPRSLLFVRLHNNGVIEP